MEAPPFKTYLALQRQQANTVGLRHRELTASLAQLILDMRRDLGASDVNVTERDLTTVLQGGKVETPLTSFVQARRPSMLLRHEPEASQTT